jgi:uncharacterized protein (TIGR03067 family)
MRYAMLILVPAVILLIAADDPSDKDQKAIQGTWRITSFSSNGKAVSAEEVKDMKVVFKDNTMTLSTGKKDQKATFKLNASKKPKTMDTKPDNGDDMALGIYELDGDTLKFSFRKPGGERPKDFTEKEGVGYMILKREK